MSGFGTRVGDRRAAVLEDPTANAGTAFSTAECRSRRFEAKPPGPMRVRR